MYVQYTGQVFKCRECIANDPVHCQMVPEKAGGNDGVDHRRDTGGHQNGRARQRRDGMMGAVEGSTMKLCYLPLRTAPHLVYS
eukprot:5974974-Pyramimonas_sp.AAC.1